MKIWEIEVELAVLKTRTFAGPPTEAEAIRLARMAILNEIHLVHFLKWHNPANIAHPLPVETIIDNDTQIVSFSEVPE